VLVGVEAVKPSKFDVKKTVKSTKGDINHGNKNNDLRISGEEFLTWM
jgi:hypothetical protein